MKKQELLLKLMLIVTICLVPQPFSALGQTTVVPPPPTVSQTAANPSAAEKATPSPEVEGSPPPNTTWTRLWLFYPLHAIPRNSNLRALVNVLSAVVIGWAGAFAFLAGVRYGFIDPTTRDKTLEFLANPPWWRILARATFYFMGGIVAGVFQWAQPDTLVPIQAFVLGATWPSVVTRIMTGSAPTGGGSLAKTPAPQLPTPPGKDVGTALASPPPSSMPAAEPPTPAGKKAETAVDSTS
jgi:hypothetical protein